MQCSRQGVPFLDLPQRARTVCPVAPRQRLEAQAANAWRLHNVQKI
ncbi:hypothetical protein DWUX_1631 [Desulfovibrio diazotrophicus]|nr:hypothetical protein DWUX_1631 [Desulfovibrio diazotrophicus]